MGFERRNAPLLVASWAAAALSGVSCSPSALRDPVTGLDPAFGRHPAVVVEELEWIPAASLVRERPERERTRAVGFFAVPARGTWCTATLIAPSAILTAAGCVDGPADLEGAEVFFRREAGVPEAEWAGFACETSLLVLEDLGALVAGCRGRPGTIFGTAALRAPPPTPGAEVYLVEQACDHFRGEDCRPDKRFARGALVASRDALLFDADALEGSLGGPVFEAGSHELVGLQLGGAGTRPANRAASAAEIHAAIAEHGLELSLGRRPSRFGAPPLPPDPFEPNDSGATATEVDLGFETAAAWIGEQDRDVYRLELTRRQIVEVELRFEHRRGDVDAAVFERSLDGAKVASGVSATDDETLRFRAALTAPHFLVVYGYDRATNEYALSIR